MADNNPPRWRTEGPSAGTPSSPRAQAASGKRLGAFFLAIIFLGLVGAGIGVLGWIWCPIGPLIHPITRILPVKAHTDGRE